MSYTNLGGNASYMKDYVALLRNKLPNDHTECTDTQSYKCGDPEPDKTFTYEIAPTSPLYPKPGTKAQTFIDGLGVRVVMIRLTPDKSAAFPKIYHRTRVFFCGPQLRPCGPAIIREVMASGPTITFHPSNGQLDVSIDLIAVPD